MKGRFAVLAVVSLAVYAGLAVLTGVDAGAVARLPPSSIIVGAAAILVSYELRALRWSYLLGGLGVRVSAVVAHRSFFSGLSMAATPAKAGELLKPYLLREKEGVALEKGLAALLMERFTDLAAVFAILAVTIAPTSLSFAALAGVACMGVVLLFTEARLTRRALLVSARMPLLKRLSGAGLLCLDEFSRLCRPAPLTASIVVALAAWLIEAWVFWSILLVLGVGVAPDRAVAAYVLGSLAGALALLPGGVGLAEGGMAVTLIAWGAEPAPVALAVIVVRVLTLWFPAAIGMLALVHWVRRDIYEAVGLGRAGESEAPRR